MTDKVYHSFGRTYRSRAAATAIQYAGGSDGWVVPSTRRLMADPEGDLATGALNAFGESHTTSSFDVTIDTGEALVGGAYLARDTTTTVTLASSTTGQTVYVGWGDSQTDTVIIGTSGAFGADDAKLPIWTFATDGSGVTSATDERYLSQVQGAASRAIVQTTAPAYNEGKTWLDPDSGVFYGAYNNDWRPIPPVTVTEEAADFTESAITISHNQTRAVNGGLELLPSTVSVDDFEDGDITTLSGWDGWNGNTGALSAQTTTVFEGSYSGEIATASGSDNAINATASSARTESARPIVRTNTTYAVSGDGLKCDIFDGDTTGNRIARVNFRGDDVVRATDGASATTIQSSWSVDTWYPVLFDFDFGNDQYYVTLEGTQYGPFAFGDGANAYTATGWDTLKIRDDRSNSSTAGGSAFVDVPGQSVTSGDATVSWDAPSDIFGWDLATFQRTLAGETVTIDVLDGSGTVLFSDISQNFDISTVGTNTNVALRANFSRSDESNNPTCDYLARRYTR